MINKIIVENFRCFNTYHEIELRPLTFLVGENSTGKTSLLSAIRLATNLSAIPRGLDFNREPFILGAYDQIASYASGRGGRARNFRIGYEKHFNAKMPRATIRIAANFISKRGLPSINEFIISDKLHNIESKAEEDVEQGKMRVVTTSNGVVVNQEEIATSDIYWSIKIIDDFAKFLSKEIKAKTNAQTPSFDLYRDFFYRQETTYAFAPVRTRPERTYDPKSDIPRPEGNHVPAVLRHLESQAETRTLFNREVEDFGSASGLYKRIGVRLLGREADPFQIIVKIAGPAKNLVDVGYGVSQVLPLLVDTLVRREPIFLMQQPEIHLHPRAQAALGTYFGHLIKGLHKQFIVETHSDYIIDRVCLDIRDKTSGIVPDDVAILFFQRKPKQPWVKVHRLTMDEKGNIQGAPKGYRDFFLKEQARLFGI